MIANATDTASATPRPRRSRRRLAALGLAAAVVAGGASVSLPATHADAAPKQQLCWYKGLFEEGGVWYSGWFAEPC